MLDITRITTDLFDSNCYVIGVAGTDDVVVVDPGKGAAAGVVASGKNVKAILLTHGHPDHTWDAYEVSQLGDDAPVYMPGPDRYWLDDPVGLLGFGDFGDWARPEVTDAPVGEWEIIPGVIMKMVPAPGHSPGSSLFLLGDETSAGRLTAFSADVIFKGSVGRTDLAGGNDEEMKATLRLLADALDPRTVLLPGHGDSTVWGTELDTNPFVMEAKTGR